MLCITNEENISTHTHTHTHKHTLTQTLIDTDFIIMESPLFSLFLSLLLKKFDKARTKIEKKRKKKLVLQNFDYD